MGFAFLARRPLLKTTTILNFLDLKKKNGDLPTNQKQSRQQVLQLSTQEPFMYLLLFSFPFWADCFKNDMMKDEYKSAGWHLQGSTTEDEESSLRKLSIAGQESFN